MVLAVTSGKEVHGMRSRYSLGAKNYSESTNGKAELSRTVPRVLLSTLLILMMLPIISTPKMAYAAVDHNSPIECLDGTDSGTDLLADGYVWDGSGNLTIQDLNLAVDPSIPSTGHAIFANRSMTITVLGNNTITLSTAVIPIPEPLRGIECLGDLTITGGGTLTIEITSDGNADSLDGIYALGYIKIKDRTRVDIKVVSDTNSAVDSNGILVDPSIDESITISDSEVNIDIEGSGDNTHGISNQAGPCIISDGSKIGIDIAIDQDQSSIYGLYAAGLSILSSEVNCNAEAINTDTLGVCGLVSSQAEFIISDSVVSASGRSTLSSDGYGIFLEASQLSITGNSNVTAEGGQAGIMALHLGNDVVNPPVTIGSGLDALEGGSIKGLFIDDPNFPLVIWAYGPFEYDAGLGKIINASPRVVVGPALERDTPAPSPNGGGSGNPQTGDDTPVVFFLALLCFAGLAGTALLIRRKITEN